MNTEIERLPINDQTFSVVYKTTFYLSTELIQEILTESIDAAIIGNILCQEIRFQLKKS